MRKSVFAFGAVVVLLLGLAARSNAGKTCEPALDNNVYRCQVKSDFGTAFEDCFSFTSPGVLSEDFDLFVEGLGDSLACDCKPGGTFKNPRFSESDEFHCVNSASGFGISFAGEVKSKGEKIKNGEVVNEFGNAFVFECVQDLSCNPDGASNPYER